MILIHPVRLMHAVGANCVSGDGSGLDQLLEQLLQLGPLVSSILNVNTLDQVRGEDTFRMSGTPTKPDQMAFRLSNGFLSPVSVDTPAMAVTGLYGRDGEPVTEPLSLDEEMGLAYFDYFSNDSLVKITYSSGFDVPEDEGPEDDVHPLPQYRVGVDIPEWLTSLISNVYIQQQRNALLKPAAPKEYGFLPTLNDGLMKSIRDRVYGRYLRPRDGVLWSRQYRRV